MRLFSRRFVWAVAAALAFSVGSTCYAAAPTPPPPDSIAECDAVNKQTQLLWQSFETATEKNTAAAYRSVDAQIWRLAPSLALPLCMQTSQAHSRAAMDAIRLEIGLKFNIAGAFTEMNLKRYGNARSFANSFDAGVLAATGTPTEQAGAALAAARKQWPGFDQFLAHWKSEMKKLDGRLDALNVPKDTQLDPDERPGS